MTTNATRERDYFTDPSVLLDPYGYFEEMRPRGPVCQLQTHDCLLVTGFDECLEVLRNPADFSSLNSLASSAFPLPFEPEGSDISAQLEAHREEDVRRPGAGRAHEEVEGPERAAPCRQHHGEGQQAKYP